MAGPAQRTYSLEDYFELEMSSEVKHEFYSGQIFAMSGASLAHVAINTNLIVLLGNRLGSGSCRCFGSDIRVKVATTGLYTYPDAVVVCGEVALEPARPDTLLNPTVIFEILSPSTERYDRGEKMSQYKTLPSIHQIVLINQSRQVVESFIRVNAGAWQVEEYGPDQSLPIPSAAADVPIGQLYAGVDLKSKVNWHDESL